MSISSRSWRAGSPYVLTGALALVLDAVVTHAAVGSPPPPPAPLAPPAVTVLKSGPGTDRGLVFVAPKTTPADGLQQGPEIVDDRGRPVWFRAVGAGEQAANFRVQTYRGQPVLTWWQGQNAPTGPGAGQGVDYVLDASYHQVAVVSAGNGLSADLHEFRLTPRGTAFITVYHPVPYDLSAVGGPADGSVVDGIAQEIDVATGAVVFEWHSLDHVPLSESQAPVPTAAGATYDYFHINAVNWDDQGNVIIDARNTWTTYKVDHRSGDILWRLGGKDSSFALGDGVAFAWQHDPEQVDRSTLRIFDNEAAPAVRAASRVIWVQQDLRRHTATLLRSIVHPDGLLAGSQGNAQALDGDHTFVGWGATGRFSEFDAAGSLLFDASVPTGWDTYRAYRNSWHATPAAAPTATARRNADGSITVHAIWNGATDVVRWIVIGGERPSALWPLGSGEWQGLDTAVTIQGDARQVAVVAQDAHGRLIGRSTATAVGE
ncbi:MAG TPA: arylsulfotransferase family protein [Polyangia bacterium]|nr:arylsulfotransferase family protein [Polyangia bacterium]